MRILLVTQYFYPEYFKSSELAVELVKRNHEVDALVGIPNYPEGVYTKGYGLLKKRKEQYNGVNVYRVFQSPRGRKSSAIGLSLNYLTYVLSATLWCLCFAIAKKRYDAIIVFAPSPITQAVPAIVLGKLTKTKVYTWVQDIWPDSVISSVSDNLGRKLKPILSKWTNWIYRNSDKILISSKGMSALVNRDTDYSGKIVYYPNWSEDIMSMPITRDVTLPAGFNIMMAGNINDGLGMDSLGDLLQSFREEKNIHWNFVGSGNKEQWLRNYVVKHNLNDTVHFYGRQPFSDMSSFYCQADAMFLCLKKTKLPHLAATVPSRLQSYMSAGKPILGMIDYGAANVIKEANCGYVVEPGQVDKLKRIILDEIIPDKKSFSELGKNGRSYYETHFEMGRCVDNLLQTLID